MRMISNASFRGRLGKIGRGQEFEAEQAYAVDLIRLNLAQEAPANKNKPVAPKNKGAVQSVGSDVEEPV